MKYNFTFIRMLKIRTWDHSNYWKDVSRQELSHPAGSVYCNSHYVKLSGNI